MFINPFLLHTADTRCTHTNNDGRRRVGMSFLYMHLVSPARMLSDNSIDPYLYPSLREYG